jgi:hypothetical protein
LRFFFFQIKKNKISESLIKTKQTGKTKIIYDTVSQSQYVIYVCGFFRLTNIGSSALLGIDRNLGQRFVEQASCSCGACKTKTVAKIIPHPSLITLIPRVYLPWSAFKYALPVLINCLAPGLNFSSMF